MGTEVPKNSANPPIRRGRRDYRLPALCFLLVATAALAYLVSLVPSRGTEGVVQAPPTQTGRSAFAELKEASAENRSALPESLALQPSIDPRDTDSAEAVKTLKEAATQIDAQRYDDAINSLTAARGMLRKYPESYLLVARALEGKNDYDTARDFYKAAIDKNPYLADAYFGYATASERLGDLESAIGGMRNYLHTERNADPGRLKVAQARSAIWEWESKLGRGVWGPTRGIPPGFTEEELKRDGRGVGIKIPIPGTEKPDGSRKYEIKHQDKFKMFKP